MVCTCGRCRYLDFDAESAEKSEPDRVPLRLTLQVFKTYWNATVGRNAAVPRYDLGCPGSCQLHRAPSCTGLVARAPGHECSFTHGAWARVGPMPSQLLTHSNPFELRPCSCTTTMLQLLTHSNPFKLRPCSCTTTTLQLHTADQTPLVCRPDSACL